VPSGHLRTGPSSGFPQQVFPILHPRCLLQTSQTTTPVPIDRTAAVAARLTPHRAGERRRSSSSSKGRRAVIDVEIVAGLEADAEDGAAASTSAADQDAAIAAGGKGSIQGGRGGRGGSTSAASTAPAEPIGPLSSSLPCDTEAFPPLTSRELDLQQQRRCILERAGGRPAGGYVALCLAVKSEQ